MPSISFGAPSGYSALADSSAPTSPPIAISSSSGKKVIRKNSLGNRSDMGWALSYAVDGDSRKIKCKYCEKVISGGVYCLKPHLACTQNDVGTYLAYSDKIKKEMFAIVANLQVKLNRKSEEHENKGSNIDDVMGVSQKWKGKEVETSGNIFKRKNTQSTIN